MIIEIFSKQTRQRNEEKGIPKRGNDMCKAKMSVRRIFGIFRSTYYFMTPMFKKKKKKKEKFGSLKNWSWLQISSTAGKLT